MALLEHKEQAQLVHDKENTDKSSTTTDCNCSRNIITQPPPPPLCAVDICCYGLRSHSGWVQSQACVLQHGCIFHSNHFSMFATCFVQPLDLVKNRMQVCVVSDRSRPSSASVLMGVVKNEGFRTLYTGLSAGLFRQATYTTTRLGKAIHNSIIPE